MVLSAEVASRAVSGSPTKKKQPSSDELLRQLSMLPQSSFLSLHRKWYDSKGNPIEKPEGIAENSNVKPVMGNTGVCTSSADNRNVNPSNSIAIVNPSM
jgi:hypothetical protein